MRAPSNLSSADYAAAVARNPTYGMLVPADDGNASVASPAPSASSTSSGASSPVSSTSAARPELGTTEAAAREQIEQIAREPGNSALKMRLAQEGVSLTDHSDVGPGKRFASFIDKLTYIMDLKAALVVAMVMSMASNSGWGPSKDGNVDKARAALHGSAGIH